MGNEGVDAAQVKMGFSSKVGGCCSPRNKGWLLSLLGFIFVILNLAALWALHFADRPSPKGSLRSEARFTTSQLSALEGNIPAEGAAVSFNSDNILRTGAGTSAYLDKLTLNADATSIDYISFAPIGTSNQYYTTNVMSYVLTEGTTTKTTKNVVTTVSYDASARTLKAGAIDETNSVAADPVRGLAALSDTQMAVLTYYQSADYLTTRTSVVPATVDGSTGKVTLNKAKATVISTTSATNFIANLTASAFVVTSYNAYDSTNGYYQSARAGSIATDGTITLSTAVDFGAINNNNMWTTFGAPRALKDLATSTSAGFVIPYYNALTSSSTKTDADLAGLCVTSATFDTATTKIGTFSSPVCDKSYRPGVYMDSVALSDDTMAIIFHDEANSNALTLVTVKTFGASGKKTMAFRSSYVFDVSGDFDFGKQTYGFWTTPRLRVLSGNRLAVSFLNPNLAGRLSIHILSFSAVGVFHELAPVMPISLPSFSIALSDKDKSQGAITHDLIPVGPDSFVTAFVGNREDVVNQNFALVENLNKPVGIIQSYSSDSTTVATQGRAEVSGLTANEFHYATTSGAVVPRNSSMEDLNPTKYVYAAGNVVVSADSRVGTAIDDDTLLISTF